VHLHGIHHVTAITADAPRNVDFYARVLGLRMVKKTVNFDAPDVYHLYYGDEMGSPGSVMTFFEFPGAPPGRPGAGMIHRVVWRVPARDSLDFWERRLADEGVASARHDVSLEFADPDGLGLEFVAVESRDAPLAARAPDIPEEHALAGFEGVRAYTNDVAASRPLLTEALGFTPLADEVEFRLMGGDREGLYHYRPAPAEGAVPGAGTVHHVAWASSDQDHETWRERALAAGMHPTPVIDRQYFRSIYFREPSGVLFEIATLGPGFTADEPQETLGEALMLPPQHEPLRERLERSLTPIENPRTTTMAKAQPTGPFSGA
jgi:glyoxalase family protein